MKKPCRACPTKKCGNCPVAIEEAALKSAANFGAAEKMWIPDPDSGEMVFIDMDKPSDEALILLRKLYPNV